MNNTNKTSLLYRLSAGCLIFTVGFAAGRWYPQIEAWRTERTAVPPASIPVKTDPQSPQAEARDVLAQLGRRVRELQAREDQLQQRSRQDQVAYQILLSQNRCAEDDVCRRLQDRRQRTEQELTEVRQQITELMDLEARVRQLADQASAPAETTVDPALVAARALLLRLGERP